MIPVGGHMIVLFSVAPRPPIQKLYAATYFNFTRETELQTAEGGNTVSDEYEAIVIKLFRRNYLTNESVLYFSWPRGAVKKSQTH
jgi:hypothetical protein